MATATASTADASLIARQLFGRGGQAMVAAFNLLDHGNALSFRFKGSRKFNHCKITLLADDTYRVEIGKIVKYDLRNVQTTDGVFCDALAPLFERTTGLYLSL